MVRAARYWNHRGRIGSRLGSLCLDAGLEPQTKGARARMWTCLRGVRSQEWEYDGVLVRNSKGLCLAAPQEDENAPSGEAVMWTCNASLGSQRWQYNESTG